MKRSNRSVARHFTVLLNAFVFFKRSEIQANARGQPKQENRSTFCVLWVDFMVVTVELLSKTAHCKVNFTLVEYTVNDISYPRSVDQCLSNSATPDR